MASGHDRETTIRLLHALGFALLVGIPAAGAAFGYELLVEETQHFLFETAPHDLGLSGLPGWWVVAITTVGAVLCALALRLPGHGGHEPLAGLSFAGSPPRLAGVLLAAFASLAFGAVLGPEAPLLALGQWLGMKAARRAHPDVQMLSGLAGAGAVLAMVFGSPLISGVVLLEAARRAPFVALLAPFLGGAVGFSIFTGIGSFGGVPAMSLSTTNLPTYESLQVTDLLIAIPLAIVAALVTLGCRHLASVVTEIRTRLSVTPVLIAGGVIVGLTAVVFRAVADEPVDLILFSGTESLDETVALGSAGVALGVVLAKGLAYSVSLGCGFRGGPVFPAVTIGVALGVAASDLPGHLPGAAAVAGAAAAACAAQMRMPFTSTVIALLIVGSAGIGAVAIAVVGAIIGYLVRLAVDGVDPEQDDAVPAPAAA